MNRMKRRGITEIKIKLLPEKAKRDYLLRMVSSIIIMVFVILNFFFVFLPRRDLLTEINSVNKKIYSLKAVYNNAFELFKMDDNSIYNINDNKDVATIEENSIDTNKVLKEFDSLKPPHSFVENVTYNFEKSQFIIRVQFDVPVEVTTYQRQVSELDYVTNVQRSAYSLVPVSNEIRYTTNYLITIDPSLAPKVGDTNE